MIYAFNFCGDRDQELGALMAKTLRKYCPNLKMLTQKNMDKAGYMNGAGWTPSMLKLDSLRELVSNGVQDDDWVLSVDSDVIFTNTKVFDWLNVVTSFKYNHFSIIGIEQVGQLAKCALGELHNMSGCSIYLRGHIAKKIAAISQEELLSVREQFKSYVLAEQEDIVISYLAQMFGAKPLPIPDHMYNGDLHKDISNGDELRCFYHLNYSPTKFLGVPVSGKWQIPMVLRQRGIEL